MSGEQSDWAVWADERVARWVRQSDALDRQFSSVSELLFAAAAVQPGETVLDVGCGTGPTTRRAAALAGPGGQVDGLDIAPEMLRAAAAVERPADSAPIEWIATDVVEWDAPGERYDLVMSRFGVMFFSDPAAAVRRLAAATRPGGRFAVAVWAPRTECPVFEVSLRVALEVLAARGEPQDEADPYDGPYSWNDAGEVTALLESGGWSGVTVTPHRVSLLYAGGADPAAAARSALDFGPTQRLLENADPDTVAAAEAAIATAFADHVDESGQVVLDGSIRVATASRS